MNQEPDVLKDESLKELFGFYLEGLRDEISKMEKQTKPYTKLPEPKKIKIVDDFFFSPEKDEYYRFDSGEGGEILTYNNKLVNGNREIIEHLIDKTQYHPRKIKEAIEGIEECIRWAEEERKKRLEMAEKMIQDHQEDLKNIETRLAMIRFGK